MIIENFIKIECCKCGIIWCVSKRLQKNWEQTQQSFYCPNGHGQNYAKSTAERLSRDIDLKNKEIETLKKEIEIANRKKSKRKR